MDWTEPIARAATWALGIALVVATTVAVVNVHNTPTAQAAPGQRVTHVTGEYKVMINHHLGPYATDQDTPSTDRWIYAGLWSGEDVPLYSDEYVLLGHNATCTDPTTGVEHSDYGDRCG